MAAVTSRAGDQPIVVGLSSNPIDPCFHAGGLDGIGVYTHALERSLRVEGIDVRRVGAPNVSAFGWTRPTCADLAFGVPLAAMLAWSMLTQRSGPFVARVEGSIDLYHSTDYLVPNLRRKPVIATLFDAIPIMRPEWGNPRLRALKNALLRSAAVNADRVITVSEAAVDEIVRCFNVPAERIRVVPLGVGEEWFTTPSASNDATQPLGLRTGYFLFVGSLQPRKNVMQLIQAYERLPESVRADHQLVIVGKYAWGVPELRRLLEDRRAQGRVIWLEHVDHATLHAVYAGAAAFVFPSLAEGFGLPVVEALASGLPVVASDLPVLREVAGNHAIFVPPDDRDALAEAMRASLAAPEIDSEQRRSWARRFSWKTCALRTIDVYRECVNAI